MSISLTTTALGVKLTDATRRSFTLGYKEEPVQGRALFDVQTTGLKTETFNSAVMDQFATPTGDGEVYASMDPTLGDEITLTQAKITASYEVSEDAQQFDQYGIFQAMEGAQGLGSAAAKAIELDLQQLISQGAATTYTDRAGNTVTISGADALAPFTNDHTVNGSSSTFDNLESTAFGQTGLEAVENLFRGFLNHDGQRINRRATTIFSTTKSSLINLIQEYNKSMGHPEDAFNGVNVYMQRYNHVQLTYLDSDSSGAADSAKDDYWGLVIAKDKNLKLRVSQSPTLHPEQLVQRNRNRLYQASAKYAYGLEDAVCIALSAA